MKIKLFGITLSFFEPNEKEKNNTINMDTIRTFLNKLSIYEQEKLFYNLFELHKNNSKLHINYKLSDIKINYENLHPMINNFFSVFEYYENYYEECFGHQNIQNYDNYLKSLDIEPHKDAFKYIVIGYYHGYALFTKHRSIFINDEDSFSDFEEEENTDNSITFFENLLFDILYDLNEDIPSKQLSEDINLKYYHLYK